jgi:predicted metal-dependent hydrolase
MEIEYSIIRSKRKTISLQIKGRDVIVRAGNWVPKWFISQIVSQKYDWIMRKIQNNLSTQIKTYTPSQLIEMKDRAKHIFPPKINYFAGLIGVSYNKVSFRNQKSRWGSCSSRGNLNFNIHLVNVPEFVLDYVIIHELCHLIEHNHSARFWSLVALHCNEYKESINWLKEYGRKVHFLDTSV